MLDDAWANATWGAKIEYGKTSNRAWAYWTWWNSQNIRGSRWAAAFIFARWGRGGWWITAGFDRAWRGWRWQARR